MSDDGSPGSALRALTTKLRHSLLDIRERALASLAFKLDNGLLGASDVGRHLPILRALLEWFNFEDTGEKGKDVIEMLRRIATEDPPSVQRLLELGADRFLRDLSGDGGEHLAPSIDSLIAFWEKAGAASGDAPPPAPPSPARQSKSASYAAAAQKAAAGASQDAQAERAAEKAAGKMAGEKAAPAPEPLSASAADADSDADAATPSATPPLDAKTKELFLRNPRLAATYWRLARQHEHLGPDASADERAAAMRAHVAEEAALADGAAASRAGEGVLKLRRVLLSPSDEQKVFELGVRLSYADQPALLLAALTELREAVLADLPPQALLQRPRAVDATIALARAVDGPTAMSRVAETRTSGRDDDAVTPAAVRTAALVTLRAFCEALKGALGHAADGAHKVAPPPTRADAPEHVLPSSQLASRAALSYPPPAGGLAAFARFAPEPNAVPAAARHALGAPMPTLPAAHRIALAVAPALASPAAAGDALGVLESVSPLLELSAFVDGHEALAEDARESESLDADALDALASRRASDAASRLGAYLHAAESALERASRNASPDGTDDALPKGECPVFFPALALAAVLIAAAGPEAAREADAAGGVPARLVERLSTAAIDELLAAAVPGLRAAALAALAALGDDAARSECAAAEAADLGMQAAETAASDDAEAAANRAPHAAARLALAALPALEHIAEDEAEPLAARLVATVLTSAASATAAADFEAFQSDAERVATENWLQRGIQDVRDATRTLLGTETSVAARRGAYAALAAAAEISLAPAGGVDENGEDLPGPDAAARAVSAAARAVMLGGDVVGEIVAGGLSDPATRVYAAKCLNCIAAGAGASGEEADAAAAALLPWLPWLECDLDDETAGPAVSAAAAAAVRAAPAEKWTPLEPLLRGLFHRAPRRRAAAAEGLARALGLTPDLSAPAQMDATASLPESARAWIDPFGGALRHADYARRVGSEADHLEPLESYAETYVAPGRPSVLASVFEPEDARELFGVLVGDARLGPSVRCAAADQLCVCAADERLESEMIRPAHLASAARLAASAAVAEGPDLDVASASLKLLAAVVSRSRRARAFFSDAAPAVEIDYNDLRDGGVSNRESPTTPYGRAAHLFPLAFHPRPSVRERFAVFAAYVVFGGVADLAAGRERGLDARASLADDAFAASAALSLPPALAATLALPVKNDARGTRSGVARSTATAEPVEAKRARTQKVRAMLTQRRETRRLGGAAGALAALERAVHEDLLETNREMREGGSGPTRDDVSRSDAAAFFSEKGPALDGFSFARIADAQLRWASPASSAMTSLARLAAARTHADALAATASLRGVLALGAPGAAAIATAAWPEGAARILTRPPRTPGDARLWAALVGVLSEAMRRTPSAPSAETLALAVETTRSAGAPAIRVAFGDPESASRRALGRSAKSDAAATRHPVAAHAALGDDDGEASAASAAAAAAAARLAAQTLDAAVAMAAAAGYGDAAPGVGGPAEASAAAATACGALLCDTDLVDATISRLVCEPSMAYGARVAGAELLASCARACALAAASRPAAALARFGGADVVAADLASRAVEPLLTFVCAARLGATHVTTGTTTTTNAKPVKSVSSYSVDYEGVTPMGGGALVDAGCAALEAIAAAAPAEAWSRAWAERGASFWLTRLARDRVAARRARAWRLLALAASPGARATRAMLQKAWPESPGAAAKTALDPTEAPAARAAAASFLAACLSATAAADQNMEAEFFEEGFSDASGSADSGTEDGALAVTALDVVPLLNRGEVWRGFADVLLACAGRVEPSQSGYVSAAAQRSLNTSVTQPSVTDPAAAAALRRGAASVLLAAARLAPAIVAAAMAPKPGDAPPERDPKTGRAVKGVDGPVSASYPPAFAAALAALDPAPWRLCLQLPPPEILAWAQPPASAAEDAAAAAANVAALVGALSAGRCEEACHDAAPPRGGDAMRVAEREELLLASRCFASARMACDTSCVPAMAASLAAAADALAATPPPRGGGEAAARDAARRAAVARACARSASGLAAALAAAPDPGGGPGATEAWSSLGGAPLACARIVDLAAGGTSAPASAAPGSAGAALADAARAACECLAAVFRGPAAAKCVAAASASSGAAEGGDAPPVGARLALSLIKLWHAQAVGTPGGTRAPGAAAFAAPHTAVASALRNVLAYSASAKRAAHAAELTGTLLKVSEKARSILAYDVNRERAARAAEKKEAEEGRTSQGRSVGVGSFGDGRRRFENESHVSGAAAAAVAALGSPPRPLAMDAETVLAECVSLIKHALYCPPDAAAAAAAATEEELLHSPDESPAALGAAAAAVRADATARDAFGSFHRLWRHAVSDAPLARELLGAVANLMAGCDAAKRKCVEPFDAGDGAAPASFAERALRLAFRNTSPALTMRLALAPLAALATEPTARRWLLRSSFLPSVVAAIENAVAKKDAARLAALLRAAADVAGGGGEDGRREVLRVGGSALVQLLLETLAAAGLGGRGDGDGDEEDDVDVILAGVAAAGAADAVFRPQLPAAATEALLLLRNVCFHAEAKAHVSSNPRCIDALVAAAGAADPGARAAAADALLALVHNGQRVAASLRAGRRPARLRRAAGKAFRAANKVAGADAYPGLLPTGEPADNAGAAQRAEAAAHASKCLAALVAVLGVSGGDGLGEVASPDSTLVDIDDVDRVAEECSDGLAIGPQWVY